MMLGSSLTRMATKKALRTFATTTAASNSASNTPKTAIWLGLIVGTGGVTATIWEDTHQDTATYWHDKPIPVQMRKRRTQDCFALERDEIPEEVAATEPEVKPISARRRRTAMDCFALNTEAEDSK